MANEINQLVATRLVANKSIKQRLIRGSQRLPDEFVWLNHARRLLAAEEVPSLSKNPSALGELFANGWSRLLEMTVKGLKLRITELDKIGA
jgi:hypothetical protein